MGAAEQLEKHGIERRMRTLREGFSFCASTRGACVCGGFGSAGSRRVGVRRSCLWLRRAARADRRVHERMQLTSHGAFVT